MISDVEVVSLVSKAEVKDTISPDKIEATEVTVLLKNGSEYSAYVDYAKGNALHKPLSKAEIIDKFRGNVDFSKTISKENAEKVLDMLINLERVDNITKLTQLLVT